MRINYYGDYVSIAGKPGREVGAVSPLECFSDVVRPPHPSRRAGSLELCLQMFLHALQLAVRFALRSPSAASASARMRCRYAGAGAAPAVADPAARWSASPAWRY